MEVNYHDGNVTISLGMSAGQVLTNCIVDKDADCEKFFYNGKYFDAQKYYDYRVWKVNYRSNPKSRNEKIIAKYEKQQAKEYSPFVEIDIQIIQNLINGTKEPVKIHQDFEADEAKFQNPPKKKGFFSRG